MRKHHLLHHHRSRRDNQGVTTALWDHVFGTYKTLPKLPIPRHVAPRWLLDPTTGDVRPELATDYEVAGRVAEERDAGAAAQPAFA